MSRIPSAPEVGILALVPDSFDEPWQSRHQILTRLSSYFQVVWVEPTPHWRDVRRRPQRSPARSDLDGGAFTIYSPPPWLSHLHRPAALARRLERVRLGQARQLLVERGCRKIVLSLWRPSFDEARGLVAHDLAAYHIDDEYTFSMTDHAPPDAREAALIESVDVVSVHSNGLMRRKGRINPRTLFLPNGVDYAAYATTRPEPADLAAIPHPRIGYTGFLKPQLDWDLLRDLISAHAEWQFIFVGPSRCDAGVDAMVRALEPRPNAHFLGVKAVDELAAYPQHFDACVMPYRKTPYADCIYPLKLHEYLAAGSPVIGTPIETLKEFTDVVALAASREEWSAAIAAALGEGARSDRCRAARQAVARGRDWHAIAGHMAALICGGEAGFVPAAPLTR
jgi:UDP-galactopyranose mutase